MLPSPRAVAEFGIPLEAADERRRQGGGTGRRRSCGGFRGSPAQRAGARAGTAARPQNHGSRNPQGGARLGTGKKTDLAVALAACGRYPVKTISGTLGVARSNIIERRDG